MPLIDDIVDTHLPERAMDVEEAVDKVDYCTLLRGQPELDRIAPNRLKSKILFPEGVNNLERLGMDARSTPP